jgi:hypothetical protein
LVGCSKEDIVPIEVVPQNLQIKETVGLKLETVFVASSVSLNIKTETAGTYVVKIVDISNKVVSKEEISVTTGDNVVKIHTAILPSTAYRLQLYSPSGNLVGIADFNKI